MAGWLHGGKSRQARSEGATCSHPSRASARTKDDVCDDDKVAVMQAPTCESLTLKRVEINAVKTETEFCIIIDLEIHTHHAATLGARRRFWRDRGSVAYRADEPLLIRRGRCAAVPDVETETCASPTWTTGSPCIPYTSLTKLSWSASACIRVMPSLPFQQAIFVQLKPCFAVHACSAAACFAVPTLFWSGQPAGSLRPAHSPFTHADHASQSRHAG